MICGALQTLNEEALEDVMQQEPPATAGENAPAPAPAPTPTNGEGATDHVVNITEDVFL